MRIRRWVHCSRIEIGLGLWLTIGLTGCGKIGQPVWPATVAGFQNFSADQQKAVSDAVVTLNQKESLAMVSNSAQGPGYPIYFELVPPTEQTADRAGLATVDNSECTIQLSSELFDSQHTDYLRPVVWHELGHCAGLTHTPQSGEIMYYTSSPLQDYSAGALTRFFQQFRSSAGI